MVTIYVIFYWANEKNSDFCDSLSKTTRIFEEDWSNLNISQQLLTTMALGMDTLITYLNDYQDEMEKKEEDKEEIVEEE